MTRDHRPRRALAVALGLMCACASESDASTSSDPPPAAPSPRVTQTITVSGQVMLQPVWCRGTAPLPQDLEALRTLQPTSKRLLFRPGSENSSAAIHTEVVASGPEARFEVRLPVGTWCVVDERKRDFGPVAPRGANHDTACLEQQQRRCDQVLELTADTPTVEVQIVYADSCSWRNPCFRGSPPP